MRRRRRGVGDNKRGEKKSEVDCGVAFLNRQFFPSQTRKQVFAIFIVRSRRLLSWVTYAQFLEIFPPTNFSCWLKQIYRFVELFVFIQKYLSLYFFLEKTFKSQCKKEREAPFCISVPQSINKPDCIITTCLCTVHRNAIYTQLLKKLPTGNGQLVISLNCLLKSALIIVVKCSFLACILMLSENLICV